MAERKGSFFKAHDDAKAGTPSDEPIIGNFDAVIPSAPSTEAAAAPVNEMTGDVPQSTGVTGTIDFAPKGPVKVGSPEHTKMLKELAANEAAAKLDARVNQRHKEGVAKINRPAPGQTAVETDNSDLGETARAIRAGKPTGVAPATAGEMWDNLNKLHQKLADFVVNLPHHIERHATQYDALAGRLSELDPKHPTVTGLQNRANSIRSFIPSTVNGDKRISGRAIRDALHGRRDMNLDIKGTLRKTSKVDSRGNPLQASDISGSGYIQNEAPIALRDISRKLEELRPGGAKFAEMGTNVNHPALMEILDHISKTNEKLNHEVKPIDGAAFGTGVSPAMLEIERHRASQGNLPVPNPAVGYEAHRETHPEWAPGGQIPTGKMIDRVDKDGNSIVGEDGKPAQEREMREMTFEDTLSTPGHVWGLPGKDLMGRRTKERDQVKLTAENAQAYLESKNPEAQTLGRRMRTIMKDYDKGNTAGYEAQMDPDERWRGTESKFGKGVTRLRGRGTSREQLLNFELQGATRAAEQRAARAGEPGSGGGGAAPVKGQTKTAGAVAKDRAVSAVSVDAINREMDDAAYREERTNNIKATLVRGGKISEEDGKWLGQRANGAILADVKAHVDKHNAAYAAVVEAHRRGEKPDQESRRIVSDNLGEQGMLQARREGIAARGE
jgi:hypothetical protein